MNRQEFNTIRTNLKLTHKQVAKQTGYSIRSVENWALGRVISVRVEKAIRTLHTE